MGAKTVKLLGKRMAPVSFCEYAFDIVTVCCASANVLELIGKLTNL